MNYFIYITTFILLTILTPSCNKSDMTITESSECLGEDIYGVDIDGAYKVKIIYGETTGVTLITSNKIKQNTSVILRDNTVFIKSNAPMRKDDSKREIIISTENLKSLNVKNSATVEINSLYNNIETIKASNSSKITITEYVSSKEGMDVEITGVSNLLVKTVLNVNSVLNMQVSMSSMAEIEKLNAADCVNLTATNSSGILIKSGLSHLENINTISASESSSVNCFGFSTKNSSVYAKNSSNISVNSTEHLKIEAHNSSQVYYKSHPTLTFELIELTESSTVKSI